LPRAGDRGVREGEYEEEGREKKKVQGERERESYYLIGLGEGERMYKAADGSISPGAGKKETIRRGGRGEFQEGRGRGGRHLARHQVCSEVEEKKEDDVHLPHCIAT